MSLLQMHCYPLLVNTVRRHVTSTRRLCINSLTSICRTQTAKVQNNTDRWRHSMKQHLQSRRWTQTKPYEMKSDVAKDTVVYSYNNYWFYFNMSLIGIIQGVFWVDIAHTALTAAENYEKNRLASGAQQVDQRDVWWRQVMDFVGKHQYKVPVICTVLGCAIGFFAWILPRRTIHKLTLLKGGNSLEVMTYTYFGRTRRFTTPLDDMSYFQSRTAKTGYLVTKIKNRTGYFLLDTGKKGKFPEKKLFDYVVGLKRFEQSFF